MSNILKKNLKKISGFTLIELLIVLVIISLFLGLILPRFNDSLSSTNLITCSKKVLAILRYARNKALLEKQSCKAIFNTEKNCLDLILEKNLEKSIYNYCLPEEIMFRFKENGQNEQNEIVFYSTNGSNGGEIIIGLKDKKDIKDINDKHFSIKIDFITAQISFDEK